MIFSAVSVFAFLISFSCFWTLSEDFLGSTDLGSVFGVLWVLWVLWTLGVFWTLGLKLGTAFANVLALTSIQDYDYKTDYPLKLQFN